jgi:hypothetical protein
VGQLAPQPDLTRQCAFDLRSRLEILAIRPDGAGRFYNVRTWRAVSPPSPVFLPRKIMMLRVPLRNRVTPLGEIVATPERGLVYGNRGCLHNRSGRIVRPQATRRWIACRLSFRGWYRSPVPQPGKYTGLFFLDDATAFSAGHRPCALCRRTDYARVLSVLGLRGADELDALLASERAGPRQLAALSSLPDGSFVLAGGEPHLVLVGRLHRWSPGGYGPAVPAPARAELLTPPSLVRVLRAGWDPLVPFLHPSAMA